MSCIKEHTAFGEGKTEAICEYDYSQCSKISGTLFLMWSSTCNWFNCNCF